MSAVIRCLAAAVLSAAAVLALGPVAPTSASSVRSQNGVITYLAAPGELNRLSLDEGPGGRQGHTVTVADPGAHMHAGPGCVLSAGRSAVCERGHTVVSDLGDRDDTLRIPPENRGERLPPAYCCVPPFGSPVDLRATLGSGHDHLAAAMLGDITVAGGDGDDSAWLWSENGFANGGAGNDLLAMAVNSLGEAHGEAGNDRVLVSSEGRGLLDGGVGHDRLTGGGQDFSSLTYTGGAGHDSFTFVCDDPRCFGDSGIAEADGGPDNDNFKAFPRPDPSLSGRSATVSGGTGLDLIDYSKSTANLNITLDDQQNDGDGVGEQDNVKSDVESVLGGRGNDRLVGSRFFNLLAGNEGNDDVTGADGEDVLLGKGGHDIIRSQDGRVDEVWCGSGFDRVFRDPFDEINNCESF